MLDLFNTGRLPKMTTARFKKLLEYGLGGSTLYKYKQLWHPNLWKTPQTPQSSNGAEAAATATPAAASHPTSLLSGDDSNPLQAKGLEDSESATEASEVRNENSPGGWRQLFLDLKERRSQQKQQARSQKETFWQSKASQNSQNHREKMLEYLRSGDPILIREGLQWASRSGLALEALPAGSHLDHASVDSWLNFSLENVPDKTRRE
jgi:hypothetical protein